MKHKCREDAIEADRRLGQWRGVTKFELDAQVFMHGFGFGARKLWDQDPARPRQPSDAPV